MNFKEKVTILFENATFGFRETDAKGQKIYSTLQLAFFTIICSTIVFVVTAGLSYNITRKKAMKDANTLMAENMDIATEIIHRHVQNVEHSGYSLSSIFFDMEIAYDEDGTPYNKFVFRAANSQKK